jgi:general secretion pathway protein H
MEGASNHEAGFTLIEALVVLAIVALLTGLAFPTIDRARVAIAAQAARSEMGSILMAARAGPQRLSRPFVLEANPTGADLMLDHRETGVSGQIPGQASLQAFRGETHIEMTPKRILFFPDGSSTGGSIRLTTGDGVTTTYLVMRDLGSVSEATKPGA